MSLYNDLKEQLSKRNINIINKNYYDYIKNWKEWYKGNVEGFHNYTIKLADGTTSEEEKLTMNMAKKVCEDMSKLLWSEKVQINLDTEEKTKKIWEILDSKENNFSIMIPQMIEMVCALGTSAFTEYIDKNGKIRIEYIKDALNILPYSYDNLYIQGVCIINQFIQKEKNKEIYYTHLTFHEFKEGKYTKLNELYKSKNPNELGKEVVWQEYFPNVEEVKEYETDTPHFQILRPNISNNYDIESPMGLSIYANSIDRFKSIDNKYDSFDKEFVTGKKRIMVDISALKGTPQVDNDGNIVTQLYYDKNDTTYVAMRGMENQPIKEIDFNLRYQAHVDSINSELNWLSANIGFGESFYSFDGSRVKTATEVLSEDSDAWRTKNSYEIVLKDTIYDLVKSICFLAGIQTEKIEIITDYSRFKDENAEQQRMERELDKGIISRVEYRMKIYNEDEKTAIKKIKEIKESEPTIKDLVGE